MQICTAIVENSMEFLKKIKIELHYDPAILLLWMYPKKHETLIQENICNPMFIAVIYNSQDLEAAQVSISR